MSWSLRLPYSTPPLSLNDRRHWAAKARITREVRHATAVHAREQRIPRLEHARVQLLYIPRDKRRRDADNLVATLKPCLDGLRDAGVLEDDDASRVDIGVLVGEPSKDPHLSLLIEEIP